MLKTHEWVDFEVLYNKTLTKIEQIEDKALIFYCSDGGVYKMFHDQDCCEYVHVEEIIGNLDNLLNSPLTMVEEIIQQNSNKERTKEHYGETWTFYKLATVKGYVTLRWYGESNGYYSESVDFLKIREELIEALENLKSTY